MNCFLDQKLWLEWLEMWRGCYIPWELGLLVNNEYVYDNLYDVDIFNYKELLPLVIICDDCK
jgi:hypothetical protein